MSLVSADAVAVLGPVVREHRTRTTYLAGLLGLGGVFTAFGLFAAVRGIIAFVKDPSGENAVLGSLMTAPFLLSGVIALLFGLSRLRRVVSVHQGGFFYRDGKGEQAVPWQMIDGVYQKIVRVYQAGIEVDVRDVYTIGLRDGTFVEVDYHFAEVDELGSFLVGTVTDRLLPGHRQAFRGGQPLDFGAVVIDLRGIHADGKSLSWGEVESLSWKQGILSSDKGFLQIRRASGLLAWAKVPIERIKNYPLLMAIASEMARIE